jgi:hypothetical protein
MSRFLARYFERILLDPTGDDQPPGGAAAGHHGVAAQVEIESKT